MWYKGFITPYWTDSFKNFPYYKKDAPIEQIKEWNQQGYNHSSFTGMMFDDQRKMPHWTAEISNLLMLSNCGYTFYKMQTGDIMPTHVDHFSKYCKIFGVNKSEVWRTVIVLTDWQPGHYFEIDGTPFVNYKAGEFISWTGDTPHSAANIGSTDRYTLQITGIKG